MAWQFAAPTKIKVLLADDEKLLQFVSCGGGRSTKRKLSCSKAVMAWYGCGFSENHGRIDRIIEAVVWFLEIWSRQS